MIVHQVDLTHPEKHLSLCSSLSLYPDAHWVLILEFREYASTETYKMAIATPSG